MDLTLKKEMLNGAYTRILFIFCLSKILVKLFEYQALRFSQWIEKKTFLLYLYPKNVSHPKEVKIFKLWKNK